MLDYMVNVNGIDLHVAEEGQGDPVLFCHGFPDTWRGWRRQMAAVTKAGYRTIAPDKEDGLYSLSISRYQSLGKVCRDCADTWRSKMQAIGSRRKSPRFSTLRSSTFCVI